MKGGTRESDLVRRLGEKEGLDGIDEVGPDEIDLDGGEGGGGKGGEGPDALVDNEVEEIDGRDPDHGLVGREAKAASLNQPPENSDGILEEKGAEGRGGRGRCGGGRSSEEPELVEGLERLLGQGEEACLDELW